MIQTLEEFKFLRENKLVPRNLDERFEKLKQNSLMLLQQESIDGDFIIQDYHYDFNENDIKLKEIIGSAWLSGNYMGETMPNWLRKVRVTEYFGCSHTKYITSLKNSPYEVDRYYAVANKKLISLEGMSKYISGKFVCSLNGKHFSINDIPKTTTIKGKIELEQPK